MSTRRSDDVAFVVLHLSGMQSLDFTSRARRAAAQNLARTLARPRGHRAPENRARVAQTASLVLRALRGSRRARGRSRRGFPKPQMTWPGRGLVVTARGGEGVPGGGCMEVCRGP